MKSTYCCANIKIMTSSNTVLQVHTQTHLTRERLQCIDEIFSTFPSLFFCIDRHDITCSTAARTATKPQITTDGHPVKDPTNQGARDNVSARITKIATTLEETGRQACRNGSGEPAWLRSCYSWVGREGHQEIRIPEVHQAQWQYAAM
jgi:hypothetical protein